MNQELANSTQSGRIGPFFEDAEPPRNPSWYVAETLAWCEKRADENLERCGFETFLPRYTKLVHLDRSSGAAKRAGRKAERSVPLFPGYIFVRFDAAVDRWLTINAARGIKRLMVSDAERPLKVPVGIVEALQAQAMNGGFVMEGGDVVRTFQEGARIVITDGPFANLDGVVYGKQRDGGIERVRILLSLLGSDRVITVRSHQICAAA